MAQTANRWFKSQFFSYPHKAVESETLGSLPLHSFRPREQGQKRENNTKCLTKSPS